MTLMTSSWHPGEIVVVVVVAVAVSRRDGVVVIALQMHLRLQQESW